MVARLPCCLVAMLAFTPAVAAPVVAPPPAPTPTPAPEIDATGDRVRVDGAATIPVDALFEVGEPSFTRGAPRLLDAIAAALRKRGGATVVIDVHTDDTAPDDDRTGGFLRKLSQARADAIRGYLIKRGLPARRLTARGRGPDAPIANNRSADGRRANRRVELAIEPDVRPPSAADLPGYLKAVRGKGDAVVATIETSLGTLHCTLLPDRAPAAVANFVGLATGQKPWTDPKTGRTAYGRPFYDGLTFHRVIPGFMIQGGDPLGVGTGGPGYQFADELASDLVHKPGALAMANAGPNTNGSQFFIDEVRAPHLDGHYSIFGQCDEVAVVTRIANVARGADDRPAKPVVIRRIKVARAPAAGPADPYR